MSSPKKGRKRTGTVDDLWDVIENGFTTTLPVGASCDYGFYRLTKDGKDEKEITRSTNMLMDVYSVFAKIENADGETIRKDFIETMHRACKESNLEAGIDELFQKYRGKQVFQYLKIMKEAGYSIKTALQDVPKIDDI